MALDTTQHDIYRGTTGLTLTPEMSGEIFAKALEESAVMQLARRIDLPGRGLSIPVVVGEPVADFVNETAEKPVSNSTFQTKTMTPYKISVIELFSNEFRRDFARLYDELVRRLPYAIGRKIDATVFHGTAPGSGFDVLTGATAHDISADTYGGLVAAHTDIATEGYSLDGFALSPAAEGVLFGAIDGNNRPLFLPGVEDGSIGRILGARTVKAPAAYAAGEQGGVNTVGIAGDWNQARFGIVEDIDLAISEEATINDGTKQINLWQRNMFAVRAEVECGFIVSDLDAFAKLTTPVAEG